MAGVEDIVLVAYDVEKDRVRSRIFKACRDFGLESIQYSTFIGRLTRNRREDLAERIRTELKGMAGNVLVLPLCEADFRKLIRIGAPLSLYQTDVAIVI